MLFAQTCAGCGRQGQSPCADCIRTLVPLTRTRVSGLDQCLVLVDYDPLSLRLIGALKYRGVRSGLAWLATALADRAAGSGYRFHVATWVPASRKNRRRRGFDQSKLLTEPVARRLDIPAMPLLRRVDDGGQTGRTREDRLIGPTLESRGKCAGLDVLVIDDVVTTGASMSCAAHTLRRSGAASVVGLAVAHRRFC